MTSLAEKLPPLSETPAATARLLESLQRLRRGREYENYLRARDAVLACVDEMAGEAAEPSAYWRAELGAFEYMLDASPLIVRRLREHCIHITGINPYQYRTHHAHEADLFAQKLSKLNKMDGSGLFVGEAPILGGFGHRVGDALVNLDTLKFYECLIAIDRAGFLEGLKAEAGRREVWLEIGAGWGGFGYVVKKRFPRVTYVMVDLPQTLLFSATYLLSAFPDARFAIYPELSAKEIAGSIHDFDFVLLPHYLFDQIALPIDLTVNMVSFQEMTSAQVAAYLARLAAIGSKRLYSFNRDQSGNNREIATVSDIIAENFAPPRRIRMLDYTYQTLVPPKLPKAARPKGLAKLFRGRPQQPAPGAAPVKAAVEPRPGEYRHLVAERTG